MWKNPDYNTIFNSKCSPFHIKHYEWRKVITLKYFKILTTSASNSFSITVIINPLNYYEAFTSNYFTFLKPKTILKKLITSPDLHNLGFLENQKEPRISECLPLWPCSKELVCLLNWQMKSNTFLLQFNSAAIWINGWPLYQNLLKLDAISLCYHKRVLSYFCETCITCGLQWQLMLRNWD